MITFLLDNLNLILLAVATFSYPVFATLRRIVAVTEEKTRWNHGICPTCGVLMLPTITGDNHGLFSHSYKRQWTCLVCLHTMFTEFLFPGMDAVALAHTNKVPKEMLDLYKRKKRGEIGHTNPDRNLIEVLGEIGKEQRKINIINAKNVLMSEGFLFHSTHKKTNRFKVDSDVDYWPTTGLFMYRGKKEGRGIRELIIFLKNKNKVSVIDG